MLPVGLLGFTMEMSLVFGRGQRFEFIQIKLPVTFRAKLHFFHVTAAFFASPHTCR